MEYSRQFDEADLGKIIEEALIYMCACPAQVAEQILNCRRLIKYQHACEQDPKNDQLVHQTIGASSIEAHEIFERCLDQILTIEGWDRETLTMPKGLRRRRDDYVADESWKK